MWQWDGIMGLQYHGRLHIERSFNGAPGVMILIQRSSCIVIYSYYNKDTLTSPAYMYVIPCI